METTETRKVPLVATPNVSRTQRAFAAGEITSDADIDILQLAQDFITELEADSWRMNKTTGMMAQELTDKYDEFVDKIDEDDEDEYEWNLYRFMFRRQQELNEARKARMAETLAKRAKLAEAIAKAQEGAKEPQEEEEEKPRVEPQETKEKKEAPEGEDVEEKQPALEPPATPAPEPIQEKPQEEEEKQPPEPPKPTPAPQGEETKEEPQVKEKIVVVEKPVEVEKVIEVPVEPEEDEKGEEKEEKEDEKEKEKPQEKKDGEKEPQEKKEEKEEKKPEQKPEEKPKEEEGVKAQPAEAKTEEKKEEGEKKKPKKGIFKALMDKFKASVKRKKDALLKKILLPLPTLDGKDNDEEEDDEGKDAAEKEAKSEEEEAKKETKKGGLLSAILRPFRERKERQAVLKDLLIAAKDKDSKVFLAPVPLRKTILSRLKDGKKLMMLWGRRKFMLGQGQVEGKKKEGKKTIGSWFSKLFKKNTQQAKPGQQKQPNPPKPTMVGRGILRAANTVNTVRNIFFKPKVHHIAVMNNAIVYPLWIKKVKDKKKKLGLLGRMKRSILGDPSIKWKPLALGWRKFSLQQDKSLRLFMKNRDAWQRTALRWQKMYRKLLKQFMKERKSAVKAMPEGKKKQAAEKKVEKMVSTAEKAMASTGALAQKSAGSRPDVIVAMDNKRKEDKEAEKELKEKKEKAEEKEKEKQPEDAAGQPAKKPATLVGRLVSLAKSLTPAKPKAPEEEAAPAAKAPAQTLAELYPKEQAPKAPPPLPMKTLEELYPRDYVKQRLAEMDGKTPEAKQPPAPTAQEAAPAQPKGNVFVRLAKKVMKKAGDVLTPKPPEQAGQQPEQAPAASASLVKEPPKAPPPPPPQAKGVAPIVQKAAEAKGPPTSPAPTQAKAPPPVNATLNTPKPQAAPKQEKSVGIGTKMTRAAKGVVRGMVSVPQKMIGMAGKLRKRQQADQKEADAQQQGQRGEKKPKPFGLGILNRRSRMGDDEAFRRNVNEAAPKVHEALDDKSIQRMGFPHKKIANALKRFFSNTSQIAKKANKDLNDVEDQINNPKKGLFATIKSWLFKIVIGGLLVIGVLTWFRKNVSDWLPRDKAGKMFHGPVIFGVQLPNFKDIFNMGRSMFYMIWTPLKDFIRIVKRGVKKFMKSNDIRSAGGFVRYIKNFVMGFIAGKIMAGIDGAMGSATPGVAAGAKSAAGALGNVKFLKILAGPLMKLAEVIPIIGTIKMAIRLASMIGGALWCLISDIFGGSGANQDLIDDVAKYGEDKVMELAGENRHGTKAGKVLIHKASKIKPLAPVANLLPEHMTAKDAKGNLKLKGLVPNLPVVNLGSGTITDEMDDINDVADKRKEKEEENAGNSGINEINKALGSMPDVTTSGDDSPWADQAGDKSARQKAAEKFIVLANNNIAMLEKAHDEVGEDFDGPFWSIDWLDDEGDNPNRAWNPQWQYTGGNAKMLKTKMPLVPFEDNSDGSKEYDLAVPWEHEVMGVLPLGVRIPKTNAAYIVDVPSWQKWRYSVGIRNWTRVRDWVADNPEEFGTEDFQKKVAGQAQDWVDYTLEPGVWARIRDGRKSGMVDRWNEWNEDHGKIKEKVAEIKEGIQPKPKPDNGSEKGKEKPKPSMWSRFWSKAKNVAKAAVNVGKKVLKYGTGIGWAFMAGKKVWSLFSRKELDEAKKKPPPPPKPPIQVGRNYISSLLWFNHTWKVLMDKNSKPDEFRRLFNIDKWFDKEPPSDEKIYKKGIGKMFYNILMAMGFKYDKAVWQNIKFLQVRAKSMKAIVDSVTAYINGMVRPYGEYMAELFKWSKEHKTEEEQQAVKKAAEKLNNDIVSGKVINKDKFMEYVAKYYMPTDIHLVVRNKEGKIIKEEGKELKGFQVPKELYDQDPKYWDEVMTLLNESALPPQSLLQLHATRIQLLQHINASTEKVARYVKNLKKKKIRLDFANNLADIILASRMRMLTKGAANIRARVILAKKEIRMYFKYRKFLDTGSLGAFRSFIFGGNKLSEEEQKELFGKQLEGGKSSLAQKMLGSISEVIADRRGLIKKMKAVISAVMKKGESAIQQQSKFSFSMVKSIVKSAGNKIKSFASGAKSIVKTLALGQIKLGAKIAKSIKKATSINIGLFKMFKKKQSEDEEIKVQVEAAAKEMIPEDDKDGKERLKNIVKLAQERKEAAEKEKAGLKNYWADLRRRWKDRISEESMHELKVASTRLSNNIMDYVGMVREIPAGHTTLVNTTVHEMPSVIELLPDIVF